MNSLTKQEQWVLCVAVALLLTGWAVKTYRTAHPPTQVQQGEQPSMPGDHANP